MLLTMAKVIAKRMLVVIPILLLVSMLLFLVLRLLPVDPAAMSLPPTATNDEIEAMREAMGLNLPIPYQYMIWLRDTLSGDFGMSTQYRQPVAELIVKTLPATIELAFVAAVIATIVGIGGGLLIFRMRGTAGEAAGDVGSLLMLSLPDFLWGLILIFVFGVFWPVLPFIGRLDPGMVQPGGTGFLLLDALLHGQFRVFWSALVHMLIPAVALGISFAPIIMRVLRSSLLDVYQEGYIAQARMRGVSEQRILVSHALKNAIVPTLTLMGVQFGFLFGGTLLIEVICSYPGVGNLMVGSVRNADLPVIQMVGLVYCAVTLTINTLVDALCVALNPKASA